VNEYEKVQLAELEDQAEYLRNLPEHTHPMVLDEAEPFDAFTVGCVVVAVILAVVWLMHELTK
jgi:hypothetical protein